MCGVCACNVSAGRPQESEEEARPVLGADQTAGAGGGAGLQLMHSVFYTSSVRCWLGKGGGGGLHSASLPEERGEDTRLGGGLICLQVQCL